MFEFWREKQMEEEENEKESDMNLNGGQLSDTKQK